MLNGAFFTIYICNKLNANGGLNVPDPGEPGT